MKTKGGGKRAPNKRQVSEFLLTPIGAKTHIILVILVAESLLWNFMLPAKALEIHAKEKYLKLLHKHWKGV